MKNNMFHDYSVRLVITKDHYLQRTKLIGKHKHKHKMIWKLLLNMTTKSKNIRMVKYIRPDFSNCLMVGCQLLSI